MKQWEIHLASVPASHVLGSEERDHAEGSMRPYLIISARLRKIGCCVACPLSTSARASDLPHFRIELLPEEVEVTGTDQPFDAKPAVILVEQLRIMSFQRFRKPASRVGLLSIGKRAEVSLSLERLFEL
ncbi:MAG: type II toxin-antitoxin system PemK/MazF family toxin [Deltaproteobacteria bacterium]|nr:type II toxin-antitoxin system PemK/MazF family toxin [Deltaproteobacteria bacterium]